MEDKSRTEQLSQIHMIRHSITEGNQKNWFYGRIDIPLAEEGVALVKKLAEQRIYPCMETLDLPEFEQPDFYTSGMLRAEETFSLIYGSTPHGVIEELKEIDFGDFEGFSHEDLKNQEPYKTWLEMKGEAAAPPKGESVGDFRKRINGGFEKLRGYHGLKELSHRHSKLPAHSIIVCHGGVIGGLMMQLFDSEGNNLYKWIPDPGHGYTITMKNGTPVSYEKF